MFSEGKYSKFDNKIKNKIPNFFEKNSGNYVYVHSFLYPETSIMKDMQSCWVLM
jgi:hypothetical protein